MSKTSTNLAMALVFLTMGACGEKMDYLTTEHQPPDNSVKPKVDLMLHDVHQSVPDLRGQLPNINLNQIDWDGDGFLPSNGDCDNFNPDVGPGFFDFCDGKDNDCDGEVDEDLICATLECANDDDCVPFITECVDSICMGPEEGCFTFLRDDDGDGWSRCGIDGREPPDCNENDPFVNPGTMELCDGKDNNCNREIDEGCPACDPTPEICDGLDNDCDGEVDEGCVGYWCYRDADGDGYGTHLDYVWVNGESLCPDGYVAVRVGDCDDNDPTIYWGAPELCDGINNDCDLWTDEDGCTSCENDDDCAFLEQNNCQVAFCQNNHCFVEIVDADDDGEAPAICGGFDCDDGTPGQISQGCTCEEAVEVCNGVDDDCDGEVDEDCDDDDGCHGHHHTDGGGHHHHGHGYGHGHDCDGG